MHKLTIFLVIRLLIEMCNFSFSVLNSMRIKIFQAYRFSSHLRELFFLLRHFQDFLVPFGDGELSRTWINAPLFCSNFAWNSLGSFKLKLGYLFFREVLKILFLLRLFPVFFFSSLGLYLSTREFPGSVIHASLPFPRDLWVFSLWFSSFHPYDFPGHWIWVLLSITFSLNSCTDFWKMCFRKPFLCAKLESL